MGVRNAERKKNKGQRLRAFGSTEKAPKGPAGTGKARKRERRIKERAGKDTKNQIVMLQEKRKRHMQHLEHQGQAAATTGSEKTPGFEKAIAAEAVVSFSFVRYFWKGAKPSGGEPDLALKLQRKELGLRVRGASIPPPVLTFTDEALPPLFKQYLQFTQGKKVNRVVKPTPIQAQTWPAALCGVDVIGIAPTGSGKTLAYILPAVTHILGRKMDDFVAKVQSPTCLVLTPTRELAKQVLDMTGGGTNNGWLKRLFGLRATAVYGGIGKDVQLDSMMSLGMPTLLSATPGRLLDLLSMHVLALDKVTYLVLDEADRMLALGFEDQLNAIMKGIPPNRQVSMFSATFALKLQEAAELWMSKDRVIIRVATMQLDKAGDNGDDDDNEAVLDAEVLTEAQPSAKLGHVNPQTGRKTRESDVDNGLSNLTVSSTVKQTVHVCAEHKKQKKLITFLNKVRAQDKASGLRQRSAVLIFCTKIKSLKAVDYFLAKNGEKCAPLHSGIPQAKREKALEHLKVGRIDTLVATDVASRGLHIQRLKYVINYDFPGNLATYCHRIGRVGRQGAEGWALSFFTRNLAPLAGQLCSLLERSKQWVDPNLLALAEGKETKEEAADASDGEGEKSVPIGKSHGVKTPNNDDTPKLGVGAAVTIVGLLKSPELNDCKGHIKRKLGVRWEVVLATGDTKDFRSCNLELTVSKPASKLQAQEDDTEESSSSSEVSAAPASGSVRSGGGIRILPSGKKVPSNMFGAFASDDSSEEDAGAKGDESKAAPIQETKRKKRRKL